MIAIGREGFQPSSNTKICSDHFLSEDFIHTFGRKTLKPDAIPSIFNFQKHLIDKQQVESRSLSLNIKTEDNEIPGYTYFEFYNVCWIIGILFYIVLCRLPTTQSSTNEDGNIMTSCVCTTSSTTLEHRPAIQEAVIDISTLPAKRYILEDSKQHFCYFVANNTYFRKRSVPAYVGDATSEDLQDPKKFQYLWHIANKTITRQRKTIKHLRIKLSRSEKKVKTLCDLLHQLKTTKTIATWL